MIGIYKITNPKGKIYIGESKDIAWRFYLYKGYFCEKQKKLHNSLKKYGWENHKFEVIELCTIEKLLEKERYWQDYYNVLDRNKGLNCILTKTSSKKQVISDETKEKISKANKGKTAWNKGKEYYQIRGTKHPFYGIKKPEFALNQTGSKNHMYGKVAPNARKVVDILTNEVFNSVREASKKYNLNERTLYDKLKGRRKNNTNLQFFIKTN